MSSPIIYYVPIPEIIAGGVQVIYEHVNLLRDIGLESYVVCRNDGRADWFEHSTAQIRTSQLDELSSYTIVIPEIALDTIDRFPGAARKILFAQNWHMLNSHMKHQQTSLLSDLGYTDVMTCGPTMTAEVLASGHAGALPVLTVTNAVSGLYGERLFRPNAQIRTPYSVLMLLRRNKRQVMELAQLLRDGTIGKDVPPVTVRIVDGIPQRDLVLEYQRADIYVHTGDHEGLPRPPMEAMACGCAVVGYSGRGGLDFMIHHRTALVAEDGVFGSLKECVAAVLQCEALKERIRRNGMDFLRANFTVERMKRELSAVFG